MTKTTRLHLVDPHPLEFDAEVVATSTFSGSPSLVLRATAFFAEGGGQLGDRGVLAVDGGVLDVVDTQVDEDGRVHHVLGAPAPPGVVGLVARGSIDAVRRRDHMSQHSGQHVLSAALLVECAAPTVSSRLGAVESTIDVAIELTPEALARAVALANDVVLDDREIRVLFPSPEELPSLGLRRDPKVTSEVRVVDVVGFDRSPCGGTHCSRTGQIGPIVATSSARYKGGTRVVFLAGRRALDEQLSTAATLTALARDFSCGRGDVPVAVAALRRELDERTAALAAARAELGRALASDALARASASRPAVVHVTVPHTDTATLRTIAAELARSGGVVGVAFGRDASRDEHAVVVERGSVASLDAGGWLKAFTKAHGGRGGGRAERAEGRLGSGVAPETAVRDLGGALERIV